MAPMQTTGERVTWLRNRRGWTVGQLLIQAQIAAQARDPRRTFGRSTLYRYEANERDPETWTVIALADALRTSTDFLLGRTADPSPCGAGDEWPVPAPEVAPLVTRLNALPGAQQAAICAALGALLDALTPEGE